MNLLFLGDIVGKPGRLAVRAVLPKLIHRERVDLTVANCENISGGAGVDPDSCRELFDAGADVLTSGNHIWRRKEIGDYLDREPRLLRPANYPPGAPGTGSGVFRTTAGQPVGVMNLIGRVFMDAVDCPFQAAEHILPGLRAQTPVIFVDMHCEATSEKAAMAYHVAGRASGVVGSHTHVQSADERILPGGTAFQTDAGMCGPIESIIGVKAELALRRFITHLPTRFEPAGGRTWVQGAVIEIDAATGRATAIRRVQEVVERP
ncbi:MAG: TIGR00282 family metallophosphoesterase [Candidatus Binatia bacterium]